MPFAALETQKPRWISEHITSFHECLGDAAILREALIARELLTKNGARFPTPETPHAEIEEAFRQIDRGNFSTYARRTNDSTRDLITVGQEQFVPVPIRNLLPLSQAIKYDAASSYALAQNAVKGDGLNNTVIRLLETSSDGEEIRVAKDAVVQDIQLALSQQILKLEHQAIYSKIVDNPALPLSHRPVISEELIPTDSLSSFDMVTAIIELNRLYTESIRGHIHSYNEKKAVLKEFLARTTRCPTTLKTEAESLLSCMEAAEAVQTPSLLAVNGAQMIDAYLIKARRRMEEIQRTCVHAKRTLTATLADTAIDDDFKTTARNLLAAYNTEEATENPLNILEDLATGLLHADTALKIRHFTRIYDQTRAQLEASITSLPASIKTSALQLLARRFDRSDPARLDSEAKLLKTEVARLTALTNKHGLLTEAISSFIADPRTPAKLKEAATRELKSIALASHTIPSAERHITRLTEQLLDWKADVKKFKALCVRYEADFRSLIGRGDIPAKLLEPGRALLQAYEAADHSNMAWDSLFHLAHGLVTERERVNQLFVRYTTAKRALQSIVADRLVPERFKTSVTTLLATDLTTLVDPVASLEALASSQTSAINALRSHCERSIPSLRNQLEDNNIPECYKTQASGPLALYDATMRTGTWDDLSPIATTLNTECEKITHYINLEDTFKPVFRRIETMDTYGNGLLPDPKGRIVKDLAAELRQKIRSFILSTQTTTPQHFNTFKTEFKALAHSQDRVMYEHRQLWKPIVTNILIAIGSLGIGLIAMVVRAAMLPAQPALEIRSDLPEQNAHRPTAFGHVFNNAFFFAKTNTQCQIEGIERSFRATTAVTIR